LGADVLTGSPPETPTPASNTILPPSHPETARRPTPTSESTKGTPLGLASGLRSQALQMNNATTARLIPMCVRPIFLV
jgi:hypothetical protein